MSNESAAVVAGSGSTRVALQKRSETNPKRRPPSQPASTIIAAGKPGIMNPLADNDSSSNDGAALFICFLLIGATGFALGWFVESARS
jgi:hypothetical protein